jgi:hypothetical protein
MRIARRSGAQVYTKGMGSYFQTIIDSLMMSSEKPRRSAPAESPHIYTPHNTPTWLCSAIDSVQHTVDHQYSLFGSGGDVAPTPDAPGAITAAADARIEYANALADLQAQQNAVADADAEVGVSAVLRTKAVGDWGRGRLDDIVSDLNAKFHALTDTDPISTLIADVTGTPPSQQTQLAMLNDLDGALGATAEVVRHAAAEAARIADHIDHHSTGLG